MPRSRSGTARGLLLKQLWAEKSDEEKAEHRRRSEAAWRARYPDRAQLVDSVKASIERGDRLPGPCDQCGDPGAPLFDWEKLEVRGWRCLDCKRLVGRKQPTD